MFTQSILNLVYDSPTAAYIYIYGNSSCNGTLTVNNALTPNSTFTQWILNLMYDSATAAFIYINGNTYCNWTLLQNNALTPNRTLAWLIPILVYNRASAAYIDIYLNTSCNGTLAANNALTPIITDLVTRKKGIFWGPITQLVTKENSDHTSSYTVEGALGGGLLQKVVH